MSEPLLAGPLAKAYDDAWSLAVADHGNPTTEQIRAGILAALRSDPEVLTAMAEALWDVASKAETLYPTHDLAATAILDALLGEPS